MENYFSNMMGSFCVELPKGDCRLAMNGLIAVNVNTNGTPEYKTYDIKTGILTNCSDFAIEIDGSFFLVPTLKVKAGDIIISAGSPCCVIKVNENSIRVFSYQRGTIEEIVPEHQVFMGNTYYYRKIFSPLVSMMGGGKGKKDLVKMMVLSSMFGGGEKTNQICGMNPLMLMLMNSGGGKDIISEMFDGAFELDEEIEGGKE